MVRKLVSILKMKLGVFGAEVKHFRTDEIDVDSDLIFTLGLQVFQEMKPLKREQ